MSIVDDRNPLYSTSTTRSGFGSSMPNDVNHCTTHNLHNIPRLYLPLTGHLLASFASPKIEVAYIYLMERSSIPWPHRPYHLTLSKGLLVSLPLYVHTLTLAISQHELSSYWSYPYWWICISLDITRSILLFPIQIVSLVCKSHALPMLNPMEMLIHSYPHRDTNQ